MVWSPSSTTIDNRVELGIERAVRYRVPGRGAVTSSPPADVNRSFHHVNSTLHRMPAWRIVGNCQLRITHATA